MVANTLGSLTPFSARLYGVVVIIAPFLLLASTIAYTTENGINNGVFGGTIGVWSCFTLSIALVGVMRLLEASAPRAAAVLTVLAIMAFSGGIGFNIQAISLALYGAESEIIETVEGGDAIAILAFLPWGLFAPLTFVLSGFFLWRTRTVAWWTGALFIAGGILFVASRPERINELAIIADVAIIAALVPVGWAMVSGRQTSRFASTSTFATEVRSEVV